MSAPTRLFSASGTPPASAPANPSSGWTGWAYQYGDTLLSRTLATFSPTPDTGVLMGQSSPSYKRQCTHRGFYQLASGHDFTGETVRGVIKGYYANAGQPLYDGHFYFVISIRLFNSDFSVERTAPLALVDDDVALTTGWLTRVHPSTTTALASVVAQANDWLVVEWGVYEGCEIQAEGGSGQTANGNSTTTPADFADGGDTGQTWIEFSGDLDVGPPTIQTLRPTSIVVTGGWTGVVGSINETSPNDSDYLQSPIATASLQECIIRVGAGTTPASFTAHKITLRIAKNTAGGDTVNVLGRWLELTGADESNPAHWVQRGTVYNNANVGDTVVVLEVPMSEAEAQTITDYTKLGIGVGVIKAA